MILGGPVSEQSVREALCAASDRYSDLDVAIEWARHDGRPTDRLVAERDAELAEMLRLTGVLETLAARD